MNFNGEDSDEAPCKRKIYCPQLMVMDINSESVYAKCKKKMQKAEDKMIFNVSAMSSLPAEKVRVLFSEFRI